MASSGTIDSQPQHQALLATRMTTSPLHQLASTSMGNRFPVWTDGGNSRHLAGNCACTSTSSVRAHDNGLNTSTPTPAEFTLAANIRQARPAMMSRSRATRLGILARRVHVIDVNARARQNVVKLIEQDFLPGCRRNSAADRRRRKSVSMDASFSAFSISTSFLPISSLLLRLRGLHAAVILEVQFAIPRGNFQLILALFQVGEIFAPTSTI